MLNFCLLRPSLFSHAVNMYTRPNYEDINYAVLSPSYYSDSLAIEYEFFLI